jgi:DNA-binding response OmpR family regulator
MVVDDALQSLRLMEALLVSQGYQVMALPDGEQALTAARRSRPDLILLDIMMPGLDGFQVCARLKADPDLRHIPVLFMSALTAAADKIRAFQVGGVDYITKPLQLEEVQARIGVHLQLRRLHQQLAAHNADLEATVSERTRLLAEANARLAGLDQAKSDFLSVIAHELRTPLNGLLSVAELMLMDLPPTPSTQDYRRCFDASRDRLLTLVEEALLLTRVEVRAEGSATEVSPLDGVLHQALETAQARAGTARVSFGPVPATGAVVHGDLELLVKAFQALLIAAAQFAAPETVVNLAACPGDEVVHLTIEATGVTVPAADIPRFFDLLSTAQSRVTHGDLGLGPALARCLFEAFGGQVSVGSLTPPGIRLSVRLPRVP